MSYDVYAGGSDSRNYTSNMGRFFHDFGVHPIDMNGKLRSEVADMIDAALARIEATDTTKLHVDYDADNGWGDVQSAVEFLVAIRDDCRWTLPEYVSVSW